MRLGRVHHPGSGALPTLCTRGRVSLQLVDLVHPTGISRVPARGHHQPPLLLSVIGRSTRHAGQIPLY